MVTAQTFVYTVAAEWTYVCSVCTVWLYVCSVCTERTVLLVPLILLVIVDVLVDTSAQMSKCLRAASIGAILKEGS